jgi:hypothetical protein
MESYTFSSITLSDLKKFFPNIEKSRERELFQKIEGYGEIGSEDRSFLQNLRDRYFNQVISFSEIELIAKIIAPILNRVDFNFPEKEIRDWYEVSLYFEKDGRVLKGRCDYAVAEGVDTPKTPLFFIQEFKPSSSTHPEYQLLSEMVVALQSSRENLIFGAYIMGTVWVFMALKRDKESYLYQTSKKYDLMEVDEGETIFRTLQSLRQVIEESF